APPESDMTPEQSTALLYARSGDQRDLHSFPTRRSSDLEYRSHRQLSLKSNFHTHSLSRKPNKVRGYLSKSTFTSVPDINSQNLLAEFPAFFNSSSSASRDLMRSCLSSCVIIVFIY